MKNFSIHCLTLTLMLVMVYANPVTSSPLKNSLQLKLIYEEAKKLLNKKHEMTMVPQVSENTTSCVEYFFCLAERSLAERSLSVLGNTTLVESLHKYNKGRNDTNCTLGTAKYNVKKLLQHIIKCVEFKMTQGIKD